MRLKLAPALCCFAVAAVFTVVWPRRTASGFAALVLHWGHPLVWVLLGAAALVAVRRPRAARAVALLALPVYLLFLATLLRTP